MNVRWWAAGVALALLIVPGEVCAQSSEHDEAETIEPPERVPEQKADLAKVTRQIVERTNAFRKEHDRPAVTVDDDLSEAANAFARFMARKDRYGHTADGRHPAERASKAGYDYCIVLENIAYEYSSRDFDSEALTKGFVQGWEHSPGHRRNMLDPDVVHTGVGVARSQKTGYYYAVQMFGRPKSLAIRFSIANRSEEEVTYSIEGKKYRLEPRYTRTHTRCRPAEVAFMAASDEKKKVETVKPADGDRYAITPDGDGYAVKKE